MKLLTWLTNLIPEQYRVGVAIKKAAYFAGKLAGGWFAAKLVTTGKLTAEQCTQIQIGVTAAVGGGLELLHDWAKLKWPNVPLL